MAVRKRAPQVVVYQPFIMTPLPTTAEIDTYFGDPKPLQAAIRKVESTVIRTKGFVVTKQNLENLVRDLFPPWKEPKRAFFLSKYFAEKNIQE